MYFTGDCWGNIRQMVEDDIDGGTEWQFFLLECQIKIIWESSGIFSPPKQSPPGFKLSPNNARVGCGPATKFIGVSFQN